MQKAPEFVPLTEEKTRDAIATLEREETRLARRLHEIQGRLHGIQDALGILKGCKQLDVTEGQE